MESPQTLVQTAPGADAGTEPARRTPFRVRRAPGAPSAPKDGLLLDRYRLLERLGAGGFGVVWRARDELLQREVAVKRIGLGAGEVSQNGERAAREAHASARLSHPAIVSLYEACQLGDAFYLISELVHGHTLGRLIAEHELDDEQVIEIGLALVEALEHAHARGVIHRDLKPQNVLVPDRRPDDGGRQAAAKLTDFGGASIAEEDALTRTGDVLGTLAYMAPEQSDGGEVGEPADLYSLSLVLYEALSGENPVRGATPAATARRIGTRLDPLSRRRRDLPRRLARAIDRALAPSPRDRGTLEDLGVALQDALEDEPPRRSEETLRAPRWEEAAHGPIAAARPRLPQQAALPRARRAPETPADEEESHTREQPQSPALQQRGLPRTLWAGLALAAVAWQLAAGRGGVALLLAAALVPLVAMPAQWPSGGVSPVWLSGLLAPVLGVAGLAGAYPAIAGQAARWRQRLALGALGYWWLMLAEPLLARRLWLGAPAGTPSRAAWEGSLATTAVHVVGPLFALGTLLGALLWGCGALVLPWIVRGRSAAVDVVAATVWSAVLVSLAPRLDRGLGAAVAHPAPRGAVLGAVLGGMIAVGARALRGPV